MTFKIRLDEFLQHEFRAHVNELLGGSQKPSLSLHAKLADSLEDMRLLSIHSVDTAAAQAGSLVNRLSPLDRLADDILSLVLQQLDNRTIFFAAKVSRRWRALSLSIPSLWANIDLSCRPPDRHMQKDQFQRRFQLLVERSKGAPLDIKLVMESTEVQSLYERDDFEDELVHELLLQECEVELEQQFESGVKLLALAPDVIARIRTLDITSMLDTFHRRFWSSGRVQQPTQQLQLPIAPALRYLRLNWARPETQKLELVLPPDLCAFESVSSLSLCAVPNLQAILPRFSGVTDLSLCMVDEDEGIELADICAWMPKLETLEIVDVFDNFAFKSLTSHPSLKRLALHGELTSFAFPMVAKQLNLDAIPEISIWNIGTQAFESAVIPEAATATAELSLSAQPCETGLRGQKLNTFRLHHFCAEDGSGRRHVVHSKHVNDCEPEIATFTTINANMRAFNEMLLDTMPRLTTLRIRTVKNSVHGVQSRRNDPVRQVSCTVLAHLELYILEPPQDEYFPDKQVDLSGAVVLKWIADHLKDFKSPLQTLRVVGGDLGDDASVLNSVADAVLFTHSSLVENRPVTTTPFPAALFEKLKVLSLTNQD